MTQQTVGKCTVRECVIIDNQHIRLMGVLHKPIGLERVPIVVLHHGFASNKEGANRGYVRFAEALAQAGIAALRFDFRGCGDSEGSLEDLGLEDLVSDALAVHGSLGHIEGIEASRLGLFGASLGGSIAVLASARHHKTKALVLWAPVASGELWYYDFLKNLGGSGLEGEQSLGTYRGVTLHPRFREEFGRMSAVHVLATLGEVPILHMHGLEDPVVSARHQEAFRAACVHRVADTCFKSYSEKEHALGLTSVFPQVVSETVSWFEQYL